MEDQIDAGDIGFFYATLRHGLDVIDPHKRQFPFYNQLVSWNLF